MRQILLSLLVSIPLVACSNKKAQSHDHAVATPTQAPVAAPTPAPAAHDNPASTAGGTASLADAPAAHPAGDHAHGSPHGGVVQSLADGHVEVKLEKTGDITVWMLDAAEKPRSAKGVKASLRPVVAGSKEVQLAHDEKADVLRGKIDPVKQDHLDGVLSITPAGGTATSIRFAFHLEGHAAGHDAHKGHDGHGHDGHGHDGHTGHEGH
ncbi:hypothetical protein [Sorangium sp. So ce1335]|uniref:hypothetical protein n=1 Tax=Sorangium sp. So ce1335 TaxID=3133335 RepID=UPI003F619F82